jgi:hypothetical protein
MVRDEFGLGPPPVLDEQRQFGDCTGGVAALAHRRGTGMTGHPLHLAPHGAHRR